MPEEVDLRGARTAPLPAGLDGRRATERVGLTTDAFLEQIGQFSTSRLWRQKEGTPPVYEARHHAGQGIPDAGRAPRRAPVGPACLFGRSAYARQVADWRFWTTV
jgi:hypothetical protein